MNPHTQDLNEMIAVLNARLESRHIEATEQAGQIGDLKRELEQSQAEVERLLKFTATCTCGTPGMDYEGPQADCMVHGAVRALNEVQAENGRLKAAIERVRADVIDQRNKTGVTKDSWKRGAYAQAVRTLRIINVALDAPSVPGSPGSEPCPLCGGAGVVPGTGEPETNTTGEPCDCVLRGES